mmetsp:Transcript_19074/g.32222  ORF Transcript_19074/g.32222 Transcript_19074/m.32222 type:complete len:225 (+) Transcript_19074:44-718(+)
MILRIAELILFVLFLTEDLKGAVHGFFVPRCGKVYTGPATFPGKPKLIPKHRTFTTSEESSSSDQLANRYHSQKQPFDFALREEDLQEKFTRSQGNGGQKVNKSSSRVELLHIPTGIKCHCQDARDLSTNRKWARKLMMEKLDVYYNGKDSKLLKKQELAKKRKRNATRKAKRKYEKAAARTSDTTIVESNNGVHVDTSTTDTINLLEESLSEEELALIRARVG